MTRISEELEYMGREYKIIDWTDLKVPLDEYPKYAMVLSLGFMKKRDDLIYVLCVLEEMTRAGVKIIPALAALYNSDKFSIYLLWRRYLQEAIQVPDTCCSINLKFGAEFLKQYKKVVFKPISNSHGQGIEIVETENRLKELLEEYRVLLLQEKIPDRGYDLRTLVLGDQILCQYARYNPKKFLKNIHQGAVPKSIEEMESIDPQIKQFAEVSQAIVHDIRQTTCLELVGIDTLPSKNGQVYLLEWNSIPGFNGAEKVAKTNIAREIVQFFFKD
jgi:glutathione synthase/RimK-type ligase-like ATP-grasp enzyme